MQLRFYKNSVVLRMGCREHGGSRETSATAQIQVSHGGGLDQQRH